MFSLFSKKQKVLGLDIRNDRIRYVQVLKNRGVNKLLSYGEEKIARVEPRNALLSALSNIQRKTKIADAIISIPNDIARFAYIGIPKVPAKELLGKLGFCLKEKNLLSFDEAVLYYEKTDSLGDKVFYKVLISSKDNAHFLISVLGNSDINVLKFTSHAEALLASCLKPSLLVPAMVINIDNDFTNFATHYPFEDFKEMTYKTEKDRLSKSIKDIYMDFYKEKKEKFGYIFVAGELSQDYSFLNYLSRETRLHMEEANPLVNFSFKENEVPIITKKESLVFATALGVAIS